MALQVLTITIVTDPEVDGPPAEAIAERISNDVEPFALRCLTDWTSIGTDLEGGNF